MLPVDHWAFGLSTVRSRGSVAHRPGSLAGLHDARKQHVGQFFTSHALAALLWRMIEPLTSGGHRQLTVLDNSAGVGRLFWPAPIGRFAFHAIDIDGDACAALAKAGSDAGLSMTVLNAPLQDTDPGRADVALINPPFGLTLTGRALRPYAGITTWGPDGPMTSAPSIPYAIAHALEAAPLVLAIVPATFEPMDWAHIAPFHGATVDLPAGLFRAEGTDVRVKLVVFTWSAPDAPLRLEVNDVATDTPALPLEWSSHSGRSGEPFLVGLQHESPTITGEVTGDRTVRIGHDGRKLRLSFRCAFARAKAMNAVLRARCAPALEGMRRPSSVHFDGQGLMDLENWLVTGRPLDILETLEAMLRELDLEPVVHSGFRRYLERRAKATQIASTPFRRWAMADRIGDLDVQPEGIEIPASAKKLHLANPKQWGSPAIRPTDTLSVVPTSRDGERVYEIRRAGATLRTCTGEDVAKDYALSLEAGRGWSLVHEGRAAKYPELAALRLQRAQEVGAAAFLSSWSFQLQDLVELTIGTRGVAGHKMGLGKTRLSLGLALTGGEHNLIAVPAHLIEEVQEEIAKVRLPDHLWQIIRSAEDCQQLRKINIVSITKLRSPVVPGAGRRTIARLLRRRIHTLVADEADTVRNRDTLQTQALWAISPKRRYGLTGTPASNYIRCALPLMVWAGGDGTATQPYGDNHPYITSANVRSMATSRRGTDVFAEKHVTLEWAVREFTEDLREGAKREIPRLRNIAQFRDSIAPHILRRVHHEPEVAAHIHIPVPTRHHHALTFDYAHLSSYIETAEHFARWYRDMAEKAGKKGHKVNLIALLAKVYAVFAATNIPEHLKEGPGSGFTGLTSKDREALALARGFTAQGKKTVIFASSPDTLRKLERLFATAGIETATYDGTIPIGKRTKLIRGWKKGAVPVLLATYGAAQLGLNWAMGSRVIAYNRAWSPRIEEQAFARVLRPQQQDEVEIHYLELQGSIDVYMRQLVEQKDSAAAAGIDYEDQMAEEDFLHLDTVIGRFVEGLAKDLGYASSRDLKQAISA